MGKIKIEIDTDTIELESLLAIRRMLTTLIRRRRKRNKESGAEVVG